MKVSKKEIIVRLLNQIYDLIECNTELKDKLQEREKKIEQLRKTYYEK
jgi:hypothetical protein